MKEYSQPIQAQPKQSSTKKKGCGCGKKTKKSHSSISR